MTPSREGRVGRQRFERTEVRISWLTLNLYNEGWLVCDCQMKLVVLKFSIFEVESSL